MEASSSLLAPQPPPPRPPSLQRRQPNGFTKLRPYLSGEGGAGRPEPFSDHAVSASSLPTVSAGIQRAENGRVAVPPRMHLTSPMAALLSNSDWELDTTPRGGGGAGGSGRRGRRGDGAEPAAVELRNRADPGGPAAMRLVLGGDAAQWTSALNQAVEDGKPRARKKAQQDAAVHWKDDGEEEVRGAAAVPPLAPMPEQLANDLRADQLSARGQKQPGRMHVPDTVRRMARRKGKKVHADNELVEEWLNDMLQYAATELSEWATADGDSTGAAELMDDSVVASMRLGVGRKQLARCGIDGGEIDRLYRALYVYTVGFHEMVSMVAGSTPKRAKAVVQILKAYNWLAEVIQQTSFSSEVTDLIFENETSHRRISRLHGEVRSARDESEESQEALLTMRTMYDSLQEDCWQFKKALDEALADLKQKNDLIDTLNQPGGAIQQMRDEMAGKLADAAETLLQHQVETRTMKARFEKTVKRLTSNLEEKQGALEHAGEVEAELREALADARETRQRAMEAYAKAKEAQTKSEVSAQRATEMAEEQVASERMMKQMRVDQISAKYVKAQEDTKLAAQEAADRFTGAQAAQDAAEVQMERALASEKAAHVRIASLENELATLGTAKDQLKRQLSTEQQKIRTLTSDRDLLREEGRKMNIEMERLRTEDITKTRSFQSAKENLTNELNLEKTYREQDRKKAQKDQTRDKMRHGVVVEKLETKHMKLEEKMTAERAAAKVEKEKLKAMIREMDAQLQDMANQLSTFAQKLASREAALAEKERDVQRLKTALLSKDEDLVEQRRQSKIKLDMVIDKYEKRIQGLEGEKQKLRTEKANLEDNLAKTEAELQDERDERRQETERVQKMLQLYGEAQPEREAALLAKIDRRWKPIAIKSAKAELGLGEIRRLVASIAKQRNELRLNGLETNQMIAKDEASKVANRRKIAELTSDLTKVEQELNRCLSSKTTRDVSVQSEVASAITDPLGELEKVKGSAIAANESGALQKLKEEHVREIAKKAAADKIRHDLKEKHREDAQSVLRARHQEHAEEELRDVFEKEIEAKLVEAHAVHARELIIAKHDADAEEKLRAEFQAQAAEILRQKHEDEVVVRLRAEHEDQIEHEARTKYQAAAAAKQTALEMEVEELAASHDDGAKALLAQRQRELQHQQALVAAANAERQLKDQLDAISAESEHNIEQAKHEAEVKAKIALSALGEGHVAEKEAMDSAAAELAAQHAALDAQRVAAVAQKKAFEDEQLRLKDEMDALVSATVRGDSAAKKKMAALKVQQEEAAQEEEAATQRRADADAASVVELQTAEKAASDKKLALQLQLDADLKRMKQEQEEELRRSQQEAQEAAVAERDACAAVLKAQLAKADEALAAQLAEGQARQEELMLQSKKQAANELRDMEAALERDKESARKKSLVSGKTPEIAIAELELRHAEHAKRVEEELRDAQAKASEQQQLLQEQVELERRLHHARVAREQEEAAKKQRKHKLAIESERVYMVKLEKESAAVETRYEQRFDMLQQRRSQLGQKDDGSEESRAHLQKVDSEIAALCEQHHQDAGKIITSRAMAVAELHAEGEAERKVANIEMQLAAAAPVLDIELERALELAAADEFVPTEALVAAAMSDFVPDESELSDLVGDHAISAEEVATEAGDYEPTDAEVARDIAAFVPTEEEIAAEVTGYQPTKEEIDLEAANYQPSAEEIEAEVMSFEVDETELQRALETYVISDVEVQKALAADDWEPPDDVVQEEAKEMALASSDGDVSRKAIALVKTLEQMCGAPPGAVSTFFENLLDDNEIKFKALEKAMVTKDNKVAALKDVVKSEKIKVQQSKQEEFKLETQKSQLRMAISDLRAEISAGPSELHELRAHVSGARKERARAADKAKWAVAAAENVAHTAAKSMQEIERSGIRDYQQLIRSYSKGLPGACEEDSVIVEDLLQAVEERHNERVAIASEAMAKQAKEIGAGVAKEHGRTDVADSEADHTPEWKNSEVEDELKDKLYEMQLDEKELREENDTLRQQLHKVEQRGGATPSEGGDDEAGGGVEQTDDGESPSEALVDDRAIVADVDLALGLTQITQRMDGGRGSAHEPAHEHYREIWAGALQRLPDSSGVSTTSLSLRVLHKRIAQIYEDKVSAEVVGGKARQDLRDFTVGWFTQKFGAMGYQAKLHAFLWALTKHAGSPRALLFGEFCGLAWGAADGASDGIFQDAALSTERGADALEIYLNVMQTAQGLVKRGLAGEVQVFLGDHDPTDDDADAAQLGGLLSLPDGAAEGLVYELRTVLPLPIVGDLARAQFGRATTQLLPSLMRQLEGRTCDFEGSPAAELDDVLGAFVAIHDETLHERMVAADKVFISAMGRAVKPQREPLRPSEEARLLKMRSEWNPGIAKLLATAAAAPDSEAARLARAVTATNQLLQKTIALLADADDGGAAWAVYRELQTHLAKLE